MTELLLPIKAGGPQPPLFLVPSAGRTPLSLIRLARAMTNRPVYSFIFTGLEDGEPHQSIEEMAADYLTELRAEQPTGPYLIGGHCFGGRVAFEIAAQLEAAGVPAALVVLLETLAPLSAAAQAAVQALPAPPAPELLPIFDASRALVQQAEQQLTLVPAAQRERYARLTRAHMKIDGIYRPRPIDAPMIQIRTAAHSALAFDGWRDFTRGGYSERLVAGQTTAAMLEPPNVSALADELERELDQRQP